MNPRIRRVAAIVRWLAIGWIAAVCLIPPLLPGGVANWEDFFDDAFLIGAIPGALGLFLSYLVDRTASRADRSASDASN